jgi:hypothetical protein
LEDLPIAKLKKDVYNKRVNKKQKEKRKEVLQMKNNYVQRLHELAIQLDNLRAEMKTADSYGTNDEKQELSDNILSIVSNLEFNIAPDVIYLYGEENDV